MSERGGLECEVRRSGKMRKEEDCGDISRVVSVAVCGVSKREKHEVRDGERRAREVRGDIKVCVVRFGSRDYFLT